MFHSYQLRKCGNTFVFIKTALFRRAGGGGLPFSAANLVSLEAYEQLFQLLTVDDAIGQAAWEIVQLLPTHKGKLDQLRALDAPSAGVCDERVL